MITKLSNKSIAVLIPCYNEEQTIFKVVSDLKEALPQARVFVYDNNSTDKTKEKAAGGGAEVYLEPRQGKGNVVRSMFRKIDADCYLLIDGDDTYPASAAKKLCDAVLIDKVDMVVGDRLSSTYFIENKRLFHNFGNKLVRSLVNLLWADRDVKIYDVMTGYRAFSRTFVKSFPVLSEGFEIETEMTVHALDKNFVIKNIPVDYKDRPVGSQSKLNTFSDGIRVLWTIFNLCREYRPLLFFNIFALLFLLFSILSFTPILIEFINTGFVPKIPTLVLSGFSAIASILSFSVGLILDSIRRNSRKQFELFLNIINLHNENH